MRRCVLLIVLAIGARSPAAEPFPDHQRISAWRWGKTWYEHHWDNANPALARPATFSITVPPGHSLVTVVIDDAHGVRVRNLLEGATLAQLGLRPADRPQTLLLQWNGLDDRAQPLPDGQYTVRGLTTVPARLTYDYSWLGPGTPPWEFYPNSGWGGDHEFPHAIACLRDPGPGPWRVVVGGRTAEGGSPGFVLNQQDRKCHAFGNGWTGPSALACADGLVWIGLGKELVRMAYHTGKQKPWPKPVKFDERIDALAVGAERFAVLLKPKEKLKQPHVVIGDKRTGAVLADWPLQEPVWFNCLAFDRDGRRLWLAARGGLFRIDAQQSEQKWERFNPPGLAHPTALTTDRAGLLFVMDMGPDWRVKVFSPEVKELRAIGSQGGNLNRIAYDPAALHNVLALSVADDGALWVAEDPGASDRQEFPGANDGYAKRIAVFGSDGRFVKHFVGGTQYGAYATALHEQDPTLALGNGVIFRVNRPRCEPIRFASSGRKPGGDFGLWTAGAGALLNGHRLFRSDVSGRTREYLLQTNGILTLLCANEAGDYRPVMAAGSHESHPAFPPVADEPKALFLWCDLNGDERCQNDEFQRLPGTTYNLGPWGGWGVPPPRGLDFYIEGLALTPVRFTAAGGPVYDVAAAPRLAGRGPYFRAGDRLIGYTHGRFGNEDCGPFFCGFETYCDLTGKALGRTRRNWPAVHGSWFSSLYQPGQTGRTIGELFTAGSADAGGETGQVICHQGNKGQAFVLTADGLFLTTLFRDTREGPAGFGPQEQPGADWTNVTLHDEPFGGWFGKQDDGVIRYNFGRVACHVVRVHDLDKAKRFTAGTVALSGPPKGLPATAAARQSPRPPGRIACVKGRFPPIHVDGRGDDWPEIPWHEIQLAGRTVARARLATDYDHLYVFAEVHGGRPATNAGGDWKHLFKSGDCLDLQFGRWRPDASGPLEADVRTLLAPGKDKPVAATMRPVKKDAKPEDGVVYQSPTGQRAFAWVKPLDCRAVFQAAPGGYLVEAKLPCEAIGLGEAGPGARLLGDIGVLLGNEGGMGVQARAYLYDQSPAAGIVSDTPSEAEIRPAHWGLWVIE